MLQGLLAHYAAEALLNAPAVVGSLDLLLNPTGLLNSIGQGFEDLVSLPLAALEAGSPTQVSSNLAICRWGPHPFPYLNNRSQSDHGYGTGSTMSHI